MGYYPGMKSSAYWHERMKDRDRKAKVSEDKLIAKVNKYYRQLFNNITKELNNFYIKYATNNNITIAEAKQLLTPIEYIDLLERISMLKESFALTGSEYTLEELQLLSDRRKITRLQALLDSIDMYLIETTHNVQITIEDHLSKMYQRSYKEALEDVGANNSEVINHRATKEVINYPYAGAMFSDRIWKNKRLLIKYIKNDLTQGIIRGDSVQKMGQALKARENVTKYQAERLIRTETNYNMTRGHLDGYIDSNIVHEFETLATDDFRTCKKCQKYSGIIVPLNKGRSGKNMPPFHPNCRCTIIPVIN